MKKLVSFLIVGILGSSACFAEKGADLLMGVTKGKGDDLSNQIAVKTVKLELDDPFLIQFFAMWKQQANLPYEIHLWADKIVNKDFESAAHLLTAIRSKAPSEFINVIKVAKLYLYWRLGLAQSFFDAWVETAPQFADVRKDLLVALDQTLPENLGQWFIEKGIVIKPHQVAVINQLFDASRFNIMAKSWNSLRKGEQALPWLKHLSSSDPLKYNLAQTIVVDFSRKGKLAASANLLKKVFEPLAATRSEDIEFITSYHLMLARLLYQAGALDAAEHYYKLVPDESEKFLQARTELLWVFLRKGDMSQIKGELASLSLDLFDDRFLPEIYLAGSIANLKLCHFSDVKESFDRFISNNKVWAGKIDKQLSSQDPEVINSEDFYWKLAVRAQDNLLKEKEKLSKLAQRSVEAALPAIGIQQHWKEAIENMQVTLAEVGRTKSYEARRMWQNRKLILDSTIRKMRFVKVETLGLMQQFKSMDNSSQNTDQLKSYASATAKTGQMKFPFDGVVWGDELFSMSADVESACLKGVSQ